MANISKPNILLILANDVDWLDIYSFFTGINCASLTWKNISRASA